MDMEKSREGAWGSGPVSGAPIFKDQRKVGRSFERNRYNIQGGQARHGIGYRQLTLAHTFV